LVVMGGFGAVVGGVFDDDVGVGGVVIGGRRGWALALPEGRREERSGFGSVDGVLGIDGLFGLGLDRLRLGCRLGRGFGAIGNHVGDLGLVDAARYCGCAFGSGGVTGGQNCVSSGSGGGRLGRCFLGGLVCLGVGEAELGEEVGVDVTQLGGGLAAGCVGDVAVVVVDVRATATTAASTARPCSLAGCTRAAG